MFLQGEGTHPCSYRGEGTHPCSYRGKGTHPCSYRGRASTRVPTGGRARTRVSPLLQSWLLRCSSNSCLVIRAPFKHLSLCIVNIYISYGYNSLKISVTFCFAFIQYHHNHDYILYTRFHGKWDDITYIFSENKYCLKCMENEITL